MANAIAARMKDYFERQIAWSGEALRALHELDPAHEDGLAAFVEGDGERAVALHALEQEFAALKNEWDRDATIGERERAEVRAVADEAARVSTELQRALEDAARRCQDAGESAQTELGRLRRGRQNARKFASDDESHGYFVDREA